MPPNIPTIPALIFLSLASPTLARTMSQFRTFFPSWNDYLLHIIETKCAPDRDAYHDPSNKDAMVAYQLADCILGSMA